MESKRYAYAFDPSTRAYLGPVRLQPSPDGVWYLPDNVVDVAPLGNVGEREGLRLAEDATTWQRVPDFRGLMLWSKATGAPVANHLALGEALPDSATLATPPAGLSGRVRYDDATGAWLELEPTDPPPMEAEV